jgi:hypothetical protein
MEVDDHAGTEEPVQGQLVDGLSRPAGEPPSRREAARRSPAAYPERYFESVALGSWKPLQAIKHRQAQLMNTGKRQLHLRLHSRGPNHRQIRPVNHVVQQRRLAHPGLTAHHQRPAAARSHILHQALERLKLPLASHQRWRRIRSRM